MLLRSECIGSGARARRKPTGPGHDGRAVLSRSAARSAMSSPSSFGFRAASLSPEGPDSASSVAGGPVPDRRWHARIPLALRGRYMLADGREYACVTRDVSRMGVAIEG